MIPNFWEYTMNYARNSSIVVKSENLSDNIWVLNSKLGKIFGRSSKVDIPSRNCFFSYWSGEMNLKYDILGAIPKLMEWISRIFFLNVGSPK